MFLLDDTVNYLITSLQLHQLIRLRGLTNLTVFAFRDNPAVDQLVLTLSSGESDESNRQLRAPAQHDSYSVYRLYTLFILRTLVLLDDQPVTTTELQLANERFGQVELSNLTRKLRRRENCLMKLQRANTELARGLDSRTQSVKVARAQQSAQEVEICKLEQELCMKDELLQSKTDELARACLKHYELERELAFHKIDSKLASALLGPPPKSEWGCMEKVQSTGEHPYLGRCRSRHLLSNVPSRQSLIPEFPPDEQCNTTSLQQVPIMPEVQSTGEHPYLGRCRSRYLLSNVPSRQSLIPEFPPDEQRDTTSLQQVPIMPEVSSDVPIRRFSYCLIISETRAKYVCLIIVLS
ncbi:hypothetical protein PHET_05509 [Paragonimus heterotremus]|uniref:Uncharacterized protein n=1 Tax=Paragonimus heterotremus TaxID=100268 RepID=A0A8J4WI14_9TREM|nr:hypothetical protein PHET_05509 [Paragonimus heterotremus]